MIQPFTTTSSYEYTHIEHKYSGLMEMQPSWNEVRLREIRQQKGMTQKELAEKAGLNQSTVSLLEQGKIDPTLKTALTIGAILGVLITAVWVFSDSKAAPKGGVK